MRKKLLFLTLIILSSIINSTKADCEYTGLHITLGDQFAALKCTSNSNTRISFNC